MQGHAGILKRLTLLAIDSIVLAGSLLAGFWLRFESGLFATPLGVPELPAYLPSVLFALFLTWLLFDTAGLYGERARLSRLDEALRLSRATGIVFLALLAASFFYRDVSFSRLWAALSWTLATGGLIATRLVVRGIESSRYRKGLGVRRAAIIGTGEMARAMHGKLRARPGLGIVPVGFLRIGQQDLDPAVDRAAQAGPLPGPVLGAARDLVPLAARHGFEMVIVTDLPRTREEALDLITRCQSAGVECRLVPDLFALMTSGAPVVEFDGIPLIALRRRPLRMADRVVKRTMDLVIASVALLVLAPVIAVVAALVKMERSGPVFYAQRRVGRDGSVFTMYKFRSMRTDAEAATGPTWAREEDPRSTRLGRVLRRSSLDEVPQLWNVLKGDMSLVGPRPEREPFVRLFGERIPRYLERLRVKSGVTGWAQVNGLRGNTSIEARTMHDIYYVENWSPGFDLRILLLTFGHLMSRARRSGGADGEAPELETDRVLRAAAPHELDEVDAPPRGGAEDADIEPVGGPATEHAR